MVLPASSGDMESEVPLQASSINRSALRSSTSASSRWCLEMQLRTPSVMRFPSSGSFSGFFSSGVFAFGCVAASAPDELFIQKTCSDDTRRLPPSLGRATLHSEPLLAAASFWVAANFESSFRISSISLSRLAISREVLLKAVWFSCTWLCSKFTVFSRSSRISVTLRRTPFSVSCLNSLRAYSAELKPSLSNSLSKAWWASDI
mmetsp:Transcript_359/g.756  ORF Transcript_359/g.756 Transcript_359/m.756 type:complete len:204 (+) Transcript_359:1215-1826(+)